MHYLLIKKTLTTIKLTELFFKEVALKYKIFNNIIIDRNSLFISAFWLKVYFYLKIKQRLNIVFYLQTNN